ELGPGGGGLVLTLVAEGHREERPASRIEALALHELRTGLGVVLRRHEALALVEERLRGRDVLARRLRPRYGRDEHVRDRRRDPQEPCTGHWPASVSGSGLRELRLDRGRELLALRRDLALPGLDGLDRKSTRLSSSHVKISY